MSALARRSIARLSGAAAAAQPVSFGSTSPVTTVTSATLRKAATAQAQQQVPTQRAFSTAAPVRPKVNAQATGPVAVTTWTARAKEAVERSRARAYSQEAQGKGENKILGFEDMQKLIEDPKRSVIIVDVREPGELIQTGRIPGAINIPVTTSPDSFFISEDEFEDRHGFPRPSKDSEVVFYCKAGVRSRGAAGLAREAGWEKVSEYPGSWLDWAAKGGKIEH